MRSIAGRYATPEQALSERTAPDDIAAAVYTHHGRNVVLRLRCDRPHRVIVIDDGGEAVRKAIIEALEGLHRVLPVEAGPGDVGYQLAREVIVRAFSQSMSTLRVRSAREELERKRLKKIIRRYRSATSRLADSTEERLVEIWIPHLKGLLDAAVADGLIKWNIETVDPDELLAGQHSTEPTDL